jgi:hypothetical protein
VGRHEDFGRRLLISVDARGYGGSDDRRQANMQAALLAVLDEAASRAMLARDSWWRQAAGDGELSVLPDSEPEPRVVDGFVREVSAALILHNEDLRPEARLRLRLAIHHGVAIPAANGFSGQGVVEVSRLVDSRLLREALQASGAELAVILSRRVFLDTVVQRHTSLRVANFRKVRVSNKEYHEDAWIQIPGADVHELELHERDELPSGEEPSPSTPSTPVLASEQEAAPAQSADPAGTRVDTTIHGDFIARDPIFGVRNG